MGLRLRRVVACFIYLFLSGITITAIYKGPFCFILREGNVYVNSFQSIENFDKPLPWPDLTICKNPRDKDKLKFTKFMTKGKDLVYKDHLITHSGLA